MDSFLNPTGISTQMATPKMSQPESLNELSQEPKSRKTSVSVEPSSLGPANSNMPPPSPAVLAALGELYEEQQASSRKVPKTCSSTEAPSTAEKAPPSVRDCKLQLESNSSQIDSDPQDDTKDDMSRSSSQNPQGPESLRVNQVPPRLGMLTTEKLPSARFVRPLTYSGFIRVFCKKKT